MAGKKVLQLLREQVVGTNSAHNPNVYLLKKKTKNVTVKTWGNTINPPGNFEIDEGVYVAFIDHMPGANYEHRVQYAFINEQNEVVHIEEATTPPDDLDNNFNKVNLDE
ncbi:MAG: hypothetical protein U9P36_06735 [Thermodesulfobacteriota bacterium]|nr:hypothetical protein [Thermodesulfobacteriota bacterium]